MGGVSGRMPGNIPRTSAGLRDALFDAFEQLRAGNIEANDAKALAALSNQICATVSLEIEVAKLRNEYPSDAKNVVPTALQLGIANEKTDVKS